MPLTRADLERLLAERPDGQPLRLTGKDLSGARLRGLTLENVVFGEGREETEPAMLDGASFRDATLIDCRFARCALADVDFRRTVMRRCDLRYVVTARTTFEDADIEDCDFYRAYFDGGTVFRPRRLRHVSLTNAWLQGATGMTREQFEDEALVQEASEDRYRGFLERTKGDAPSRDLAVVTASRFGAAAAVYRALSGLWGSQGFFGDAGWAYARSRDLERRDAAPWHAGTPARWPRWLALTLAKAVSGYGLSIARVLASIGAVWLIPGLLYALTGAVRDGGRATHALGDTLLFSLGQLTSSSPARLTAATELVEWAGTAQILLGVTLLGLLGFVLGNAIRSS